MPTSSSSSGTRDPNCSVTPITHSSSSETNGSLNVHPCPTSGSGSSGFRVGVSVDRNKKCRRTMEDAHSFIYDFGKKKGQGFFAVFDGHAGKHAAEWCGKNFHDHLLENLSKNSPPPSSSSSTSDSQDSNSQTQEEEPEESIPSILNSTFIQVDSQLSELASTKNLHSGCTAVVAFLRLEHDSEGGQNEGEKKEKKRVLYVGNVGDARAVLSRGGKAVRLSYDHKGSDLNEVKRITDAGGFVLNNRVNGVLAVTRALGDSSMKEFVVGSPYTTETKITSSDSWLIVACDGLWDVCTDEEAVEICEACQDAQEASQRLLDHALANFSTDNLSVLVVDLKAGDKAPRDDETGADRVDGEGVREDGEGERRE
ncbi:hypothetical protein JCM5353_002629 [Sporobolomyces roseus]